MKLRIGLLGFNQMGRCLLRQLLSHLQLDIVLIADPMPITTARHLLQYDTLMGRFPVPVEQSGNILQIGEMDINWVSFQDIKHLSCQQYPIDVLVDTSNHVGAASQYEAVFAQNVGHVLSLPWQHTLQADTPVHPMWLGSAQLPAFPQQGVIMAPDVISSAALPVLQALQGFHLQKLVYTVVHAYSEKQRLADVPGTSLRNSRSAPYNIIPNPHQSLQSQAKLFLKTAPAYIAGMTMHVPIGNGSLVDMVLTCEKPIDKVQINNAVASFASENPDAIEYTEDAVVSSDALQSPSCALFDSDATLVLGNRMVKVLSFFDNYAGYARNAAQLLAHLAKFKENA